MSTAVCAGTCRSASRAGPAAGSAAASPVGLACSVCLVGLQRPVALPPLRGPLGRVGCQVAWVVGSAVAVGGGQFHDAAADADSDPGGTLQRDLHMVAGQPLADERERPAGYQHRPVVLHFGGDAGADGDLVVERLYCPPSATSRSPSKTGNGGLAGTCLPATPRRGRTAWSRYTASTCDPFRILQG